MRKFKRQISFLLLSLLPLFIAGCADDVKGSGEGPPEEATLTVDRDKLEFNASGDTVEAIEVTAKNVQWDARVEGSWIHIGKTDDGITVTVDDNISAEIRVGKVIVFADNDAVEDKVVTVTQAAYVFDLTFTAAHLNYWGDYYEANLGQYDMILGSGDVKLDDDGYVKVTDGRQVILENLCLMPEDYFDESTIHLTPGRYDILNIDVNGPKEAMTSFAGEYLADWDIYNPAYISTYEDGDLTEQKAITGGWFNVAIEDGVYAVSFFFELDDDTELSAWYAGTPKLHNNAEPPYYSTLTGDIDVSGFTKGDLEFHGDLHGMGMNVWRMYVWKDGISRDSEGAFSGTGEMLQLELYTDMAGSTTELAAATYTLSNVGVAGNALYGYVSLFTGSLNGCWYIRLDDGEVADKGPMDTGSVVVSGSSASYSVRATAVDDNAHNIKAAYDGTLTYSDHSSSTPPPPPPPPPPPAPVIKKDVVKSPRLY